MDLDIKIRNFLSISDASLQSKNNIVVLIAPNRAGKTQLMLILYSIFWSLWKYKSDEKKEEFEKIFYEKLKHVYLIKKIDNLIQWKEKKANFSLKSNLLDLKLIIEKKPEITNFSFYNEEDVSIPVYLQMAGLGDYYKGIYSLNKYYPRWKLISEAITDTLTDLFILSSDKLESINKQELELFEKLYSARYFVQNERIFIQEKGKKYSIEKSASGLKSLSWLYLIIRYNLLDKILFLDEPEVNLHPLYIDRLVKLIVQLSKKRKIFIATHSDYFLESLNKEIKAGMKIDVWEASLDDKGAKYTWYEAKEDNLIDTSALNETYLKIVEELFGYKDA